MSEIPYIGNELHLFQHASNWKKYYARNLNPFIKGDVLEVGAGIGSTTNYLNDGSQRSWLCLEPDSDLFKELEAKTENKELPARCTCIKGIVSDLKTDQKFDTILYIDVIEHIEDDHKNNFIKEISLLLKNNAFLLITTPRKDAQAEWLQYSSPGQPIEEWIDEKSLQALVEQNGFQKILLERASISPNRNSPEIEIYQLWLFKKQNN